MKKVNIFIFSFFILSIIGVIMIYSASSIWAEYKTGSSTYFLVKQLLFFLVAIIVFIFVKKIDYMVFKKYANHIFFICLILLILVLIPGIGMVRGGARSWIGIAELSLQPSELMKIGMIVFTAKFLSNYPGIVSKIKYLFLYVLVLGLVFGLIMLEPDFGTGFIIILTIILMLFIGLVQYKYLFIGGLTGLGGMVALILSAPYRLKRIFSFLDPWSDPLGAGFQIIQSLYAISPSSLFGYGLFKSKQKFFYLPEPQTDFIFAIVCEELGVLGALVIIFLFFILIYLGIKTAINCKELFGMYLSFGLTSLLFIQFFINIGVVIGLLPVTGVTLPFLSYGGSSLLITFLMMGIIVNVMSQENINDKVNLRIRGKNINFKIFSFKKFNKKINKEKI